MEKLLDVKNLKVEYHTDVKISQAVRGVSFAMEKGEILGVVGESGSGKSTVALTLMLQLPQTARFSGEVIFKDKDLIPMSFDELRKIRGSEISTVFQEPMTSLNPLYKAGRQVEEILKIHDPKLTKELRRDKVLRMFKNVDLEDPENVYESYPHELSGGMQQRVMIAMALMNHPDLLIADEPTTALDADVQDQILELLKNINRRYGTSIIFISHDLRVIRKLCDRTLVMYKGEIVEEGPVECIFEAPVHEYTRSLIAAMTDEVKQAQPFRSDDPVLKVEDLSLYYIKKTEKMFERPFRKYICRGLSFDVKQGEIVGLVGPSGCGKSSVCRAILGLQKGYSGQVILTEKNPQMIFQDSASSLNPGRKIGWILEEPLKNMLFDGRKLSRAERKERVLKMLEKVELSENMIHRYPSQLSGGQKQRVNIALALISGTKFIIADEPVSALDVTIQDQILKLLLGLQKELGLSMLFISHDRAVVDRVCDRVIDLTAWKEKR